VLGTIMIVIPGVAFVFPYSKVSSVVSCLIISILHVYFLSILGPDSWYVAYSIALVVFCCSVVLHVFVPSPAVKNLP
jgi:hypothetical protein